MRPRAARRPAEAVLALVEERFWIARRMTEELRQQGAALDALHAHREPLDPHIRCLREGVRERIAVELAEARLWARAYARTAQGLGLAPNPHVTAAATHLLEGSPPAPPAPMPTSVTDAPALALRPSDLCALCADGDTPTPGTPCDATRLRAMGLPNTGAPWWHRHPGDTPPRPCPATPLWNHYLRQASR